MPADLEIDDKEDKSIHFLIKNEQELVATCRIRVIDDYAKLERMAVKSKYREQGIGSLLIDKVEEFARKKDLKEIKLHAQVRAQDFYQKNKYQIVSDEFIEAGIKHVKMKKEL